MASYDRQLYQTLALESPTLLQPPEPIAGSPRTVEIVLGKARARAKARAKGKIWGEELKPVGVLGHGDEHRD